MTAVQQVKILRVIDSCKTTAQLKSCETWVDNIIPLFERIDFHLYILRRKMYKLRNGA